MFSDIVGSTPLVEALGDEAWAGLLRWHDTTMRGLASQHHGVEQDHLGDGFMFTFESADDAIYCAREIQATLAAHRDTSGFAPQVRIGIHTTEALETTDGYAGSGVRVAARVGSLAGGGEVVVSRATIESASSDHRHGPFEAVEIKGASKRADVASLS